MTLSSLICPYAFSAEINEQIDPPNTKLPVATPSQNPEKTSDPSDPPGENPWKPEDGAPIHPKEEPGPKNLDQVLPALNGPLPGIDPAIGNCIITGEVSDAVSLNPIPGAFVDVVGTGRSAETDNNGRFTIGAMPAGTFTLEATKLGYSSQSSVVTTLEGQPAETRFGLREKPADDSTSEYTLEEEVVVGEYQGDSQGDLFMELQTTPSIASGIGKDDFSRSGIGDAGDAVSKISGANIVGGRYAVVRGLGDRYSNTLVNSALISSADPSKKAVQLDLFPSDLLESVSIYKTFVPELPAEFAGGTVAIETLRFPDEPIVKFEYGLKANNQLNGDFYGSGDELGYFGRVNDDLPSSIPSLESGEWTAGVTRFPPRTQSQRDEVAKAIQQASALHLSTPLRPIKKNSKTPESFALTLGNTFQLVDDWELGVVLAGTSSNGDTAKRDIAVGRSLNSGSDGIVGNDDDFLNRTQIEDRYTSSAGYGLLGAFGFRSGDRHQVNFTAFENHNAEDEVTRARKIRDDTLGSGEFARYAGPGSTDTGPLQDTPFGATAATYQALDNTTPLRRTLTLKQLSGHHEFLDEDHPLEIDWMISRNDSIEDRPATRSAFFTELDFADPNITANVTGAVLNPALGSIFTLSDIYGINPPLSQSFRETLSTNETAENERFDALIPIFGDDENSLKIKIGANDLDRFREVRGRFFTYNIGQRLNDSLLDDSGNYGIDYLEGINGLTDPNGNPIFNGYANGRLSPGIYIEENTTSGNSVRNVDAGTEITAFYAQANLNVEKWNVTSGVRHEAEDRSFEVLEGLNPAGTVVPFTTISEEYWLPGLSLSRTLGYDDEFKLTYAWSRTVARPTFFEFAPIRTVDQATGDIFRGNSALTDTRIENYDLRFEWLPGEQSLLAASLFLKDMQSPIAQTYGLGERTFVNGETGNLKGLELEINHRFNENWSITSNYTYIQSELSFYQPQEPRALVKTTFDGQPGDIFNLILGWNDDDSGWAATLNYNFTGSYLTSVPSSALEPPVRREPFEQVDLVIQKKFQFDHGVGIVTLNVANLLDEEDTESFEDTGLVYRSYRPGRTYGIKFEYQF